MVPGTVYEIHTTGRAFFRGAHALPSSKTNKRTAKAILSFVAERGRFELPADVSLQLISSQPPSTSRTPLHAKYIVN